MRVMQTTARAVATLAIAVAASTLLAAPAVAHNELVSSTPAAGALLTSAPTQVSLTFSDELDPASTQLAVVDSGTRSVLDGVPRIDGPTVTQALKADLLGGEYRVSYRVLSQDGHSVSGTQSFTVRTAAASPSATPASSSAPTADASHETSEAVSQGNSEEGGSWGWWIVGGAVVVALCVAAGSVLVWRRRSAT
ncbi:MAG: copper resistance CopC family protein [Mycobacteriales bacterium]